jgi:hypothetical protein
MKNLFISIWNVVTGRTLTSNILAERQLENARVDLLDNEALAEYHTGMTTVLRGRVRRLEARRKELADREIAESNNSIASA